MTMCQLASFGPVSSSVVRQAAMSVSAAESVSKHTQRKMYVSNVEAGLKRWEFGELAFWTAQLYFGQYMRTSGASF